jgi:hypothetical protein
MAVGAIVARIVTQYSAKGSKQAQKDINKLGKDFDKFANRTAKAFGIAAAASAAFAIKVGKDAVRGAMEDQKQQIALATALRNVTGATDEAIAKTVEYLDKLELLVGVDNNQLIPSLQILTQATKDVTTAQNLQSLALDISAGRTLDLTAVSLALAKAIGGNVGALTRLGVPLDADAVKAKDLDAILKSLAATFSGQAEKRAATFEFRMITLGLAFNQILDQLGYALLPVLEKFATIIATDVLPKLDAWISANKDQLAASLETIIDKIPILINQIFNLFSFIERNLGTIKTLGAILVSTFAGAKVYAGVIAIVGAINILTAAFGRQAAAATAAGTATAFATGGVSAIAAVAGLAAFTTAALISYKQLTKNNKELTKIKKTTTEIAKSSAKTTVATGKTLGNTVKLTAEQKKQLASQEALNKLKSMGVVPTSEIDPIQLEAVRLNLLKEQNLKQREMYDRLLANYEATERLGIASQRYADILTVIADNKVTSYEVETLSKKWGITTEEVLKYVGNVLNVPEIDGWDFEGLLAAKGWEAALDALNKYLKALAAKTAVTLPEVELPIKPIIKEMERQFEPVKPADRNIGGYSGIPPLKIPQKNVGGYSGIPPLPRPAAKNIGGYSGIPTLMANGGIVTKATSAIIGEAGPEAVIPLSKMGSMGTTVNITVNGSVTSASDLTEFVRNGILAGQTSGRVITSSVVDL